MKTSYNFFRGGENKDNNHKRNNKVDYFAERWRWHEKMEGYYEIKGNLHRKFVWNNHDFGGNGNCHEFHGGQYKRWDKN